MRIGGAENPLTPWVSALPEPVAGRSRLTSISKGICLPPSVETNLNELKLTAHRLLMDDEAEIGSFLLEPRPRLKLLHDTIDIEADDLLEAKKVNVNCCSGASCDRFSETSTSSSLIRH
jgi:hypothetical protein